MQQNLYTKLSGIADAQTKRTYHLYISREAKQILDDERRYARKIWQSFKPYWAMVDQAAADPPALKAEREQFSVRERPFRVDCQLTDRQVQKVVELAHRWRLVAKGGTLHRIQTYLLGTYLDAAIVGDLNK